MSQSPRRIDRHFARFCRLGDPSALAVVFDGTAPELLRVAHYLVANRADAEDLVQRTFLAAIESRHSFRRGDRVLPWLLGILANHARRLRRERARAAALPLLPPRPSVDPLLAAAQHELEQRLRTLRSELVSPYAEVLQLHVEQGLAANEIAVQLARPAGTVRTQLVRAMALLRRRLPDGFVTGAVLAAAASPAVAQAQSLARMRAQVLRAIPPAPAVAAVGTFVPIGGLTAGKAVAIAGCVLCLSMLAACLVWPSDAEAPSGPGPVAGVAAADGALAEDPVTASRAAAPSSADPQPTVATRHDERAQVVRGVVVGADGRERAGVTVRGYARRLDCLPVEQETEWITDADGRFEGSLAEWTRNVLLVVAEAGWVSRRGADDLPSHTEELRIVIHPVAVEVSGRVADAAGRPLGGVRVLGEGQCAVTDELGNYRLAVAAADKIYLRFECDGQLSLQQSIRGAPGNRVTADAVLQAPTMVRIRIVDESGQPVVGARARGDGGVTFTDRTGRCRVAIDPQDPGVVVMAEGYPIDQFVVREALSGEEQSLVLQRGRLITGTVVDEGGAPVTGGRVISWDPYGSQQKPIGPGGSFGLEGIGPMCRGIVVEAEGFVSRRWPLPPVGEGLVCGMQKAFDLRGQVIGTGGGLANAGVQAFEGPIGGEQPVLQPTVWTDAQGFFVLRGLPRIVALQVRADGHESRMFHDLHADVPLEPLALTPSGLLHGRVLDEADGAPIQAFRVRMTHLAPEPGEAWIHGNASVWSQEGMEFRSADGTWSTAPSDTMPIGAVTGLCIEADGHRPAVVVKATVGGAGCAPIVVRMRRN